jgi:hypothetical protein
VFCRNKHAGCQPERWQFGCNSLGMGRCLMILTAVLWIAATAAFLLYVPVLPLMVVVFFLFGLGLMFALGVETGRKIPESQDAVPLAFSKPKRTSTHQVNTSYFGNWKSMKSAAYSKISSLFFPET